MYSVLVMAMDTNNVSKHNNDDNNTYFAHYMKISMDLTHLNNDYDLLVVQSFLQYVNPDWLKHSYMR